MAKLNGGHIAGGNPSLGRVENDYYATSPKDSRAFFDLIKDDYHFKTILEPAAGGGHLLDEIKHAFPNAVVTGQDLINRGRDDIQTPVDYLTVVSPHYDAVITNPPFKYARQFTEKALGHANVVMMFAKLQWLEGVGRKRFFADSPLKYVYVYSFRASPWRNGEEFDENGKKRATTMAFAWYIFENGYSGEPTIRWI